MAARQKKGSILDLNRLMEKRVRVKLNGGREVTGTLKGFDQLLNLVLDQTDETVRDPYDCHKLTKETRPLGLAVCRGTAVMLICPMDGTNEIENPFVVPDAAAGDAKVID